MSTETKSPVDAAAAAELERVYRQYYRVTFETALHVMGNFEDAEEVVHDIFVDFFRSGRSIITIVNPQGYFIRAAKYLAMRVISERRLATDGDLDLDAFEAPAPEPPDSFEQKLGQLNAFMQTLKPKKAIMIRLKYLDGHTNEEIAWMLGMSVSMVGLTLWRLRQRLLHFVKGEQ